jgi:hypothetical protein
MQMRGTLSIMVCLEEGAATMRRAIFLLLISIHER